MAGAMLRRHAEGESHCIRCYAILCDYGRKDGWEAHLVGYALSMREYGEVDLLFCVKTHL